MPDERAGGHRLVTRNLVGLKMPRALEILDVTVRGIERGEITAIEAIDALLTEELTLVRRTAVVSALQMAKLSAIKTLTGFDFAFQPRSTRTASWRSPDCSHRSRRGCPPDRSTPHRQDRPAEAGVEAVKLGRSVYFSSSRPTPSPRSPGPNARALCARESDTSAASPCSLSTKSATSWPVPGGGTVLQLVNARYERATSSTRTAASPSGETSSATPSSLPQASTAFCIMPSCCKSRGRARLREHA